MKLETFEPDTLVRFTEKAKRVYANVAPGDDGIVVRIAGSKVVVLHLSGLLVCDKDMITKDRQDRRTR